MTFNLIINRSTGCEMLVNYVHISVGVCYGAGVLTVDLLRGAAGESVTFTTSVKPTGEPFLALTWSFNGIANVITSTSEDVVGQGYENRITLDKSTGSLVLRNLTEKDSGEYELIIIPHGAVHTLNDALILSFYSFFLLSFCTAKVSIPTIACPTENLIEGKTSVNLTCDADGFVSTRVWVKDGQPLITASDRVQLTNGGATLTIVSVTRYDQGPFRCHVFNAVSNGTSDPVKLSFSYGPDNINLTSPSKEYYVRGSNITLSCSAVSRPAALFQWFLNGDRLSDTGPELRLMNIQNSQSGNYSCQAFNNRTMRNQTSQVPSYKKTFISPSNELRTSVSLSCSASGSFPSFLWLNGSSEVTASERVQLTDEGSTLSIINVTRYDQGPFICHVFNNFSNYTSDPVKLSISFGPENINLKLSPSQEYYDEGSNIILMCSADSRPSAQIQWFLNGDLLSDTGPELRLMNIQMSQSGNYSCQAFNNRTMRYETSQPAVSNVVVTSNNAHLFEFSSSVSLSCSSSGSSLSFLWLNGSSEVTASDRVQLTGGGTTLSITYVTRYDQGPFRCNVSNGVGSGISRPLNLFIQYGPDNVAIMGPASMHVGDFTMLYCSTMSVPSASFTWLFNGEPTSFNEAVYVISSIRRSNSGTYTCSAVNAVTGQTQTVNHELTVIGMRQKSNNCHINIYITMRCNFVGVLLIKTLKHISNCLFPPAA
uniref:Ig-like domain-containing protein n=1 Tax=Dicentrarchus labrax TaxID=13489 RepID=A0A8C4D9N5_DICLA